MTSAQVFLSEFLQYDLYHSIGAYSVARDGLADLEKRMTPACGLPHVADAGKDTFEPSRLLEVTRLTQRYNDMLAEERDYAHRSEKGEAAFLRRPIPDRFPLTSTGALPSVTPRTASRMRDAIRGAARSRGAGC
jgi:hypothetical protein